METPQNTTPHSSKIQSWQLGVGILSTVGLIALAIFVSSYTPTKDSFSKFTSGTPITAQNAATNWTGGSDNIYRSRLTPNYVTQLDSLTTAILRKGANMTDTQFKSYLTNLSLGITALGSRAPYSTNTDVQNILGFLVYEVNSTVTAMGTSTVGANALTELTALINSTSSTTGTAQTDARTNVKNFIQANITDVDYILAAMLITKVDPSLVASVTQELGYRDITEQVVVDHTNANISKYLADTDGKLRAKGVVLTQAHLDAFKAAYGNGSKVVAMTSERGSGSTGSQGTASTLTPAQLASQKAEHDSYFSLSSLKTETKLSNPSLYSQITSRSNYQLSDYFDVLPIKQLSGFKGSLWCLGYGRTSADANEVCSGLETSVDPNNTLPNSEYETRYILSPLPRAKKLIDGWKATGTQRVYTNQYDRAVTLNPNFDYSMNTAQLKKFRVYLPKGTVSFSLKSGVPQWARHAWAVKLGSPPETTRKPSNAEYVRNVTDRNIGNPNMTELRILRGEETIVAADGGGQFGIGNERIGIYEKSIANAGLQYADDAGKQIWYNRDQYELKEGQWLYITELERASNSYLDQINSLIIVKKPILDNEMNSLQFDSVGDPVFKGFTNSIKNDPFKGDPARSYITDAYFESLVNPTSSDPKERCVSKISRWVSDASFNPNNSTDPDCQYQTLTPELLRGNSGQ